MFYDLFNGKCESIIMCFFESFDRTFKYDGGFGGWTIENHE